MADPVVLDASAFLAFLLKEDQTKDLEKILATHPLFAPELLWYETANGVVSAKRSNRSGIRGVSLTQLLEVVQGFSINAVPIPAWWKRAVSLVQHYDLTFYDASYVACARALDLPILTLDGKIIQVCKEENVHCIKL